MKILSPDGIPILELTAWLGALMVAAFAYAFGLIPLVALRNASRYDRYLISICAGLALLMGASAYWRAINFGPPLASAIFILFNVACAVALHRSSIFSPASSHPAIASTSVRHLWLIPLFAWLLLIAPAFCPPMNYDVLEYHLGVVPHWMREGAIKPIPHVFYTAQPLATEVLYWIAASIEGTPWGYAPGIVQWLLVGLTLALLARVLRAVRSPDAWIAPLVLLFLVHPVIFPLALDRMTDLTGAMFMLAGLLLIFAPQANASDFMRNLIIGIFIGAAIASKWTNAGTSALILFLAALGSDCTSSFAFPRLARRIGSIAFGALLTLGPWLIWNFMHNGNPFAPFLASWFPTERWDARQYAFLIEQHHPRSLLDPRFVRDLVMRLASHRLGPPLLLGALVLAIAARVRPRRRSPYLGIAIGILLACVLWGQLGQAATRFLAPVVAASVVLLGAVAGRAWPALGDRSKLCATMSLILALVVYLPRQPGLRNLPVFWELALGRVAPREVSDDTQPFFDAVNALPKESRVMAIGEARSYFFTRPVTLATVFDRHPIRAAVTQSESWSGIADRLRTEGFTHLAVNEYELARLLQFHPPLELLRNAEFNALRRRGAAAWPELLAAFPGWCEFACDPLTEENRLRYVQFLGEMKRNAEWVDSPNSRLTLWIAPLSPPASSP